MDSFRTRKGSQFGTMPAMKARQTGLKPQPRYAFTGLRDQIYIRDAGQCQYCGTEVGYFDCNFDHIVPWDAGGRTEAQNIVVACKDCNKLKGRAIIPLELRPI